MPSPNSSSPSNFSLIHLNELPFTAGSDEIFFYDPSPRSEFAEAIDEHLTEIQDCLGKIDFSFYYIPEIQKELTKEIINYRFPGWEEYPIKKLDNTLLKDYIAEEDRNIGACFLSVKSIFEHKFFCFQLKPLSQSSILKQVEEYKEALLDHIGYSPDFRYCISLKHDEDLYTTYETKFNFADDNFDYNDISEEIREEVERLHQEGFNEFVLRCMVPVKEKLSRIIITPEYDILLPDYGKAPIEMSPLPKAVFLLFLKHEEGIYFKELMDYRKELKAIYAQITNRISDNVVNESLNKITNPTVNAINEKCSRIKEAFLLRMDERIADHYYITGKRGEKKRITLPRELVEWQTK